MGKRSDRLGRFRIGKVSKHHLPRETTYTCFAPSEPTSVQQMELSKSSIPYTIRSDGSFLNPKDRSLEKIRNQENFPSLLDGDSTAHTSESENLPFERIYQMWSEKEKADSPMLNGRKVTDYSITNQRVSNMQKRSPSPKIMSFLTQDRKFDQSMAQNDSRNKTKHDRQDTINDSGKKGKGTIPVIPSFLKAFPRPSKIMNDDPKLLVDDQSFDDEMKSILFQKDTNDNGNLDENEDSSTADESIEGGVRENLELAMDGSVVRGQVARHNNHYQYSYRDISHEGRKLHSQSSFDEVGHKAADPYLNVDVMTTVGSEVTVKTGNTRNPNDPFQSLDNASTSGSEITTRTGNTTHTKYHKAGTRGINNYPFDDFQDVEEDNGKGNEMDDEIPDSAFEAGSLKHQSDFSHSMKVSASFDDSFEINAQDNFQESNHFVIGLDGSQIQSNVLSSNRLSSRRQNDSSFSHSLHVTSQSTEGKSQKPNFSNSAGSDVFDGLSDFAFSSASSNGIDYFANKSSFFSPSELSNVSKKIQERSEDDSNHLDTLHQKISGGMQFGSSGHSKIVGHSQPKSRISQPVSSKKDVGNVSARIHSIDRIGDSPFNSKHVKLPSETLENQYGDNENINEVNKSMHFQIGKESKYVSSQHAQNAVMDIKATSNRFLSSSSLNEDDRHQSPGSAQKPPFYPSKSKGDFSSSEETPHDKIKIQGGASSKSKRNVSNELLEKSKVVNGTEHEKFENEYIHKPHNNLVTTSGGFSEQTNDQQGKVGNNIDESSSSIGASPHVKINARSQKKSEREDLLKHLQFLVSPSASGAYVGKGSSDEIYDENKISEHSAQLSDKNQFKDEKVKNLDGIVVEETDVILNARQERNDNEDSLSSIRWIPSMLRLYKQRIRKTKTNSFDANKLQNPLGKVHLQEENDYHYQRKGTSESPRSVFDHFETDTEKHKLEPSRLYKRSIQSADSSRIPKALLITDCELPASQFLALFINDTFGSEIHEPHQLVSGITEDGELARKQKGRLVSYLNSTKNDKHQRFSKTDECHIIILDKVVEIHNRSLFYLENDRIDDAMENYEVFLDQCGEGMFQGDVEITKAVIGTLLHNLGLLHILIGEYDMSVEFLNEATNVRRDANPEAGLYNRDVATSLNTMGMAYFASGCYEEALKVFADVLHILQEITNSDHIHISHVLNNVGITYFTMQEINSSLEAFEEALEIHRSFLIDIFGRKTNLDKEIDQEIIKNTLLGIAYTLCNMAYIYSYTDSPREAKFLLEEALITEKTILADNKMDTGKIQKFLSNFSLQ